MLDMAHISIIRCAESSLFLRLVEICRMEKGKDGKPVNRKIPIEPQLAIQEDDSIGIEVNSSEIEQLYRALASFGE